MDEILERAQKVQAFLVARYPSPKTVLFHMSAWQLLVATVLAAQCTDERVNKVTPELFSRWPDPASIADASIEDIEKVIHSTGFYHAKAKHLKEAGQLVKERFGGVPPKTIKELVTLPGVARKTANIVLFGGYGINEGIAVDTHVKRLSFRLGLTKEKDPVKVESDLMKLFPQDDWGNLNHRLVLYGREVCSSRSPRCTECGMNSFCPKLNPK